MVAIRCVVVFLRRNRSYAILAHDPGDTFLAAAIVQRLQIFVDARTGLPFRAPRGVGHAEDGLGPPRPAEARPNDLQSQQFLEYFSCS